MSRAATSLNPERTVFAARAEVPAVERVAAGRARRGWMLPREHGAYAQLGLPLLAALGAGRPTPAAWLLAAAAFAGFLAHEPLLILLGQRGARARIGLSSNARGRLTVLLGAAAGLGAVGLLLAPRAALVALAVPLAAAAGLGAFALRRREKTIPGEILAAVGLAGAALPVAVASGWRAPAAAAAFVGWAAGFSAITSLVWSVAHKRSSSGAARVLAVLGAAVAGAAGTLWLGPEAAASSLPLTIGAAVVAVARPAPKRLRQLGWGIAAAGLTAALAVIAIARS